MTINGTPFPKRLLLAPRTVVELRRDMEELIMQGFRQDKEPTGLCVTSDSYRLLLQAAIRQALAQGKKFDGIILKEWLGLPLLITNYDGVWFRSQVKADPNPPIFPLAEKDLTKGDKNQFKDKSRWAKDQVTQRVKKAKGQNVSKKSRGKIIDG